MNLKKKSKKKTSNWIKAAYDESVTLEIWTLISIPNIRNLNTLYYKATKYRSKTCDNTKKSNSSHTSHHLIQLQTKNLRSKKYLDSEFHRLIVITTQMYLSHLLHIRNKNSFKFHVHFEFLSSLHLLCYYFYFDKLNRV